MDLAWLLVVPAYLLGTFPTAILVGRRAGRDVTQEGSGNPGASNTFRTLGRRAGALVLLGDVAKGGLAAGIGAWIAYEAMLNIAVVTAIVPFTGVALPFISYGGTAMVTLMAGFGILMSLCAKRKLVSR